VRGVSERIERKCRHLGIRTTLKSKGSIGANNKKQPEWKKIGVVYVPGTECDSVYIGEAGRTLEKRISEHKRAVKRHNVKNGKQQQSSM